MTTARVLRLHPGDNVGIALGDLSPGQEGASEPVPRRYKFALGPIRAGEFVRKYGQIIGTATGDIAPGAHAPCAEPRHGGRPGRPMPGKTACR